MRNLLKEHPSNFFILLNNSPKLMGKIKWKNWSLWSRQANEKRVQKTKIKIKFQNSKKYRKVIKFIENSMPFTICYLKRAVYELGRAKITPTTWNPKNDFRDNSKSFPLSGLKLLQSSSESKSTSWTNFYTIQRDEGVKFENFDWFVVECPRCNSPCSSSLCCLLKSYVSAERCRIRLLIIWLADGSFWHTIAFVMILDCYVTN